MFLLSCDILVTTAHVAFPIRIAMLWPFDLISCFVFFATFANFGNSSAEFVQISVGFLLLVFLAAVGKRSFERQERLMFLVLLEEKQKRFRAEFRLAQRKEELLEKPSKKELLH